MPADLPTDVAALQDLVRALEADAGSYRAAFEAAATGVVLTDLAGRIQRCNPGFVRVLGRGVDECRDRTLVELAHPDDAAMCAATFRDLVSAGHSRQIRDLRLTRKDSSWIWARLSGSLVRDAEGKPKSAIVVVDDVTERRLAHDRLKALSLELAEKTELLEAMLHHMDDGVLVRDAGGRLLLANPAMERVLGRIAPGDLRESELAGANAFMPDMVTRVPTNDLPMVRALRGEAVRHAEVYVNRPDAPPRWLSLNASPMRDHHGKIRGAVLVARDVTDRHEVERMKDELVSTVNHELRTPLTAILGSLQLLSSGVAGELPERARELVVIAERSGERLVRLVSDLLDLEKFASGRMSLRTERLDVAAIVREATLAHAALGEVRGVSFDVTGEGDCHAIADADRLIQVVANLLSNALKFSPNGGVIEVTITRAESHVTVAVRDHGPGVPPAFRGRIFQRFSQADASDARLGGSGLGLSICKVIVEAHRGTIGFDSLDAKDGGGARFHFALPAASEAS
jgi:PAS domain S-box-containing protein